MFKYIKENLSTITHELIKDYIKNKIVYSLPFIFSYGGNMIIKGSVASVENEFRIWYKGIKIEPNAISYFLQITQTF